MSADYFFAWMMVFLRSLGVILQLPLLAGRPIPIMMRVGIGACLATLLAGVIPSAHLVSTGWELLVASAGEVILGLLLGFVASLSFTAVEMAGRIVSNEVGLTASPGLGVPEPANEPLASLFSSFAIVLFFLFGGHQVVLAALSRSFTLVPAGAPAFAGAAGESLIMATSHVLELGLRLSAPFIAMNFLVTLSFSMLGKVASKMNVFVLSFSVRTLLGLGLLASSGALLARYLYTEYSDIPARMLQMVH